jgi:hypothetical protein
MTFKELVPDNTFTLNGTKYAKIKRYIVKGVPHNAIRLEDNVCGFLKDSLIVEVEPSADDLSVDWPEIIDCRGGEVEE